MIETAEDWRVLVAEDDDLFAEAIDTFLSDAGFSVVVTGDGEAALREADADGFDALVTDLRMPRVDGVTLIRRLRDRRPDLPVIVMSGHAPENWQQSLQREGEGPLVLLGKPTKMGDLVRALLSILPQRPHH